ncbi:MAG: hypothetical protein LBR67_07745 [Dysgonamonadaceae bacterium]|jgi:hypothetical protein|nr:hypothetical protein [Dysgonamonadaceae bacterium]
MNKINSLLKSCLPHIAALAFFFILIVAYFYPAFEGKVLQQGDIVHFKGMAQELLEYGKPSGWTGSMFSGMPSYHITGYVTSPDFLAEFKGHVLGAVHSETAGPILILLISAYLLFLTLRAPVWLSTFGAVGTAFASFNIIIIVAGHVTQAWAIAFVPLVIAGMVLIFRGSYQSGFLVFALGLALEIIANHLQITYYTALFCAILFIGFLATFIQKKSYLQIGKATGVLALGVLVALGANLSNLYLNYESGKESLRGKAELTPLGGEETKVSDGLDKNYAFEWSYGKAETLTIMIPNLKGGESGGTLDSNSNLFKELKAHGANVKKGVQTATFWGEKRFTSGPVYFGAIICFLFVFALLILPGQSKWWLLGATVFFICLSWGRNFAWFNDFMFYHFPLYNKFRTPEMALVIPGFIFPMLAVMGLKELYSTGLDKQKLTEMLAKAFAITGGVCLILWILPGLFFDFRSSYDDQYQFPEWYYAALIKDRRALLQSDALRSFIFILLAAALIYTYIRAKDPKKIFRYLASGLIILLLFDMWQVDKRYLNTDNFVNQKTYNDQSFRKTVSDNAILEDKSPSYRVLNLNQPFLESRTSYYHKSIGGYHAAKLGRYQDLIDRRILKEMESLIAILSDQPTMEKILTALQHCPTLNMLNTRYIVYNQEQEPIVNPFAYGNAWFVDAYRFVNTPDEEMAALNTLNPQTEAVMDAQFKENVALSLSPDSTDRITLTSYAPDKLEYLSNATHDALAVFSEVYYPHGWKAYIDGQQVPISRADWILRAIVVPAGSHRISMEFDPDGVKTCGKITTAMSGILLLLAIGSLIVAIYRKLT